MFDLWSDSFVLVTSTPGRTSADGVKLDKTTANTTYTCWWTTGTDQRLLLKAGGESGQFRQGDATVLLQDPGVDFNTILKLDYKVTHGGLTYQIIAVNTRPRGFVYLTLQKVTG